MSSTAGKWREEQVLIICPGSRTTMAQLGCSELTPPTRRMPTRMFKDGDQWAPYQRTKRMTMVNGVEEEEWVEDMDEDEGAVYPIEGIYWFCDVWNELLIACSRAHCQHERLSRLPRPRTRPPYDDIPQHPHHADGLAAMDTSRLRDHRPVHL